LDSVTVIKAIRQRKSIWLIGTASKACASNCLFRHHAAGCVLDMDGEELTPFQSIPDFPESGMNSLSNGNYDEMR
jgi:hypothetical protein